MKTLDWSNLNWNKGFKSKEIAIITASQGAGRSTFSVIQNKTVYYVMNTLQNEFVYPVYKTEEAKYNPFQSNRLRLLMMADIAFTVENGNIKLVKHRNYDASTYVLSDEELKQYRWYMLQAIDAS